MTSAELLLSPGGIICWASVGLIAGWLAGIAMQGARNGVLSNLALGLIGGLAGGFLVGLTVDGAAGFWVSIVIAFVGANMLIMLSCAITPRRIVRR